MTNKHVGSLADAVRENIAPGDLVALGGFLNQRKPMALVREIVRQQIGDLELLAPIGSIDVDVLLGAGLVRRLIFNFCNLDVAGSAPWFRKSIEDGRIEFLEYGNMPLTRGLEAAERDLPYMPTRALVGSQLADYHPGVFVDVNGGRLLHAPPVRPDVTLLHVQWSDPHGNVQLDGEAFDFALAKASKRVVVTAESISSLSEYERLNKVELKTSDLDAVVVQPFGAHPTSCHPFYTYDLRHIIDYADSMTDDEASFQHYVERWGVQISEECYLDRVGGARLAGMIKTMDVARAVQPRGF